MILIFWQPLWENFIYYTDSVGFYKKNFCEICGKEYELEKIDKDLAFNMQLILIGEL